MTDGPRMIAAVAVLHRRPCHDAPGPRQSGTRSGKANCPMPVALKHPRRCIEPGCLRRAPAFQQAVPRRHPCATQMLTRHEPPQVAFERRAVECVQTRSETQPARDHALRPRRASSALSRAPGALDPQRRWLEPCPRSAFRGLRPREIAPHRERHRNGDSGRRQRRRTSGREGNSSVRSVTHEEDFVPLSDRPALATFTECARKRRSAGSSRSLGRARRRRARSKFRAPGQ